MRQSRVMIGVALVLVGGSGCMADTSPLDDEENGVVTGSLIGPPPELDTFVARCLEIDDVAGVNGDANMVEGADADGTVAASIELPACSAGEFIDWENLLPDIENHRVFDLPGANGRDTTAFPGSNQCVAGANVLAKMDLTFGSIANNSQFVYLGLQRAATTGDAAYYWLFTRLAPTPTLGTGPCGPGEEELRYDISGPVGGSTGDVLVRGAFQGGGGVPLLEVYQATAAANAEGSVDAVSAIDFTNPRWALSPAGVAAVAVNTTPTEPALGSDGVRTLTRGNLPDVGSFAEAAVPTAIFTGGAPCGVSLYTSVISRSSGSGGTSPDLKDLLGPFVANFGSLSADASMTGLCDLSADFAVTNVTGPSGSTVASPGCTWTFDDGGMSSLCSGNHVFPASGARSADVTVTDPTSQCSVTIEDVGATVLPPLAVDLVRQAAAPICPGMTSDAVTYAPSASGGNGTYSYTWTGVTCTGSSCTVDPADGAFCVGPTQFRVSVSDTSGICTSAQSELESYQKVTTVTASDIP